MKIPALVLAVFTLGLAAVQAEPDQAQLEKNFAAMLKGATLHGTWAPVKDGKVGEEKQDAYRIARAEKKEGDQWHIVTKVKREGQEVEHPIPVTVKFAGDAAVVILEDSPAGENSVWSARVLFHDDVYAGHWWGKEKKGTVSGVITREGE